MTPACGIIEAWILASHLPIHILECLDDCSWLYCGEDTMRIHALRSNIYVDVRT